MFSVKAKSINYMETYRGLAYSADLMLNGKKIGIIENAGDGGPTLARIYGENRRALIEQLQNASDEAIDSPFDKVYKVEEYLEQLISEAEKRT